MDIEDEMAMHETNRWELKELVLEMISDAYENGYEPEIRDLSDEDLASDLYGYSMEFCQYPIEDILAAVKEVRNVH